MTDTDGFRNQIYRYAFEQTPDIVLVIRSNGDIIEANQAAVRHYGYHYNELLKRKIYDLWADTETAFSDWQRKQPDMQTNQFETLHRRKNGTLFPVEVSSHVQVINGESIFFCIVRDISGRKQMEDQLRYLATHDTLTSILNRYSFEQALRHAVAKAEKGKHSFLLFIDLDNFKLANDTFGHAVGDQMLVNVTSVIRANLRQTDILARIGGDEFAVLLDAVSADEAAVVAEKLRAAVEEELCLDMYGTYFKLTLSIGVAEIDGSFEPCQLLSLADKALYVAKGEGKNRIKVN